MPYSATVFNVLIASPSDVPAERDAIAACLHAWNAIHSKDTGKVLLPVMWESHAAPSMSNRPQGVINEQVVRNCDMLIGAFWTRLGSPTGLEASGTVEEIKWFLKQKKPVMLYFSKAHVDPNALDTKQWEALKAFKAELSDKGLFWQYESVPELKQLLNGQLTIIVREINVGTSVDSRAVKRAIATAENVDASPAPRTARSEDEPVTEEDPYLEFYSDKSFVIRGNSLAHKDALKELKGGSWIKPRTGARTWCFSNKRLADVAKILGIQPEIRPAPQ